MDIRSTNYFDRNDSIREWLHIRTTTSWKPLKLASDPVPLHREYRAAIKPPGFFSSDSPPKPSNLLQIWHYYIAIPLCAQTAAMRTLSLVFETLPQTVHWSKRNQSHRRSKFSSIWNHLKTKCQSFSWNPNKKNKPIPGRMKQIDRNLKPNSILVKTKQKESIKKLQNSEIRINTLKIETHEMESF